MPVRRFEHTSEMVWPRFASNSLAAICCSFYVCLSLYFWQMEKNAAAGRAPSSVPLSTPPPAALNLSPRYGSLSPVNADPLNDSRNLNAGSEPTNFSLPPSFAEDDHRLANAVTQKVSYDPSGLPQNFEESRNDRLPSGG